jgi:hypothetical protein
MDEIKIEELRISGNQKIVALEFVVHLECRTVPFRVRSWV